MRASMARLLALGAGALCAIVISIPASARSPASGQRGASRTTNARHLDERWDITVMRNDGRTIAGHVTRRGPISLRGGRLRGTIAGNRITGDVADAAGVIVTTFSGTLERGGGVAGTYRDVGGASGDCAWDGPLIR
jgi:hypothetical protein